MQNKSALEVHLPEVKTVNFWCGNFPVKRTSFKRKIRLFKSTNVVDLKLTVSTSMPQKQLKYAVINYK